MMKVVRPNDLSALWRKSSSSLVACRGRRRIGKLFKEFDEMFSAADENGGAFNGLTLVGDLPPYVATGTMVIVR